MGFFDLEEQFAFYGAYHSNPMNKIIHTVFVLPFIFTILIILYFTPPIITFSSRHAPIELWGGQSCLLVFNFGFLFTLIYAFCYVSLDRKAGSFAAFLLFLCWVGSTLLANRLGFSLAWKVVLVSQLLIFTVLSISHAVFEKRAPVLLSNLVQAFLMEPFFVLLEALHFALGYEPYPGFHARVQAKIDSQIEACKDKKQKKIT